MLSVHNNHFKLRKLCSETSTLMFYYRNRYCVN